jgi:hypothetical protein
VQVYSKGASLFLILRPYLDRAMAPLLSPSDTVTFFTRVLRTLLARGAYATFTGHDFYTAIYDEVNTAAEAQVGPGKAVAVFPFVDSFRTRIDAFIAARSPAEQRVVGSNGSATPASWFYLRTYPHVHAELPGLVVPGSYLLTLLNLGANQTRWCQWNMTQAQAEEAGVADASECSAVPPKPSIRV